MKPGFFDFHLFPLSDWEQLGSRLSGGNARHVLIVMEHQEDDKELTDFLGKILSAAKLNLEEDTLLLKLTKGENISLPNLSQAKPVKYVLLFGVGPRQLGVHFPLVADEPTRFGKVLFLYSPPLRSLFEERKAETRPKAASLWKNLKQLFVDPDTP